MNQLMINDLSVTEELGRAQMSAVRGGRKPGCWEPPKGCRPGGCFPGPVVLQPISNNQAIQQGLSVMNISGGGAFVESSVANSGNVSFSANNSFSA